MHHVAIAEEFELRRSPRAQVSQAIAAVDDDRSVLVESVFRFRQQLRERQMDRTTYRGGTMFMSGKHVNHLAALGDDVQNITMIDDPHSLNSTRARTPCEQVRQVRYR